VLELFPDLAQVEPWEWAETEEGEPVLCIERHATFTGLDDGAVDLTTTIRNSGLVGVWRIATNNRWHLVGLSEDPLAKAAEQAKFN
jgi:hypothetical protein